MRKITSVIALFVALVTIVIAWYLSSRHEASKRKSVSQVESRDIEPSEPVSAVLDGQRQLSPEPNFNVVAPPKPVNANNDSEARTSEKRTSEILTAEESRKAYATSVQARFDLDSAPRAESRRMENKMRDVFSNWEKSGVSIRTLQCREHLCQVEFEFVDKATDGKFFESVMVPGGSSGTPFGEYGGSAVTERTTSSDGRVKVKFFLAREGSLNVDPVD